MLNAIGSEVDLSDPNSEYNKMVGDLLNDKNVGHMKDFTQHGQTTTFQHCINVSYYNYLICKLLALDARAAARGGLLHDMFLYDWHSHKTPVGGHNHAIAHAGEALSNAQKCFSLSEKETEIIQKHMFPINPAFPHYKETVVIIFVDKICSVAEVVQGLKRKMLNAIG